MAAHSEATVDVRTMLFNIKPSDGIDGTVMLVYIFHSPSRLFHALF